MFSFICEHCCDGDHDSCPGKTRCDCHHKTVKKSDVEPVTGPPGE